jgi:hypothetical protein
MELNWDNAPRVHQKGEPFKAFATLELLAALVSLVHLVPPREGKVTGTARLVGLTDNQGNSYLLTKMMSSRFSLCIVSRELAAQMEH